MNVETWTTVPLRRSNATALASAACAMVFLLAYEPEEVGRIEFMRASAVILIALHAAFHVGTLNALKFMAQMQVDRAAHALESYRDPRRISHLDLAAAWMAFHALTPYVSGV
jgi:hypothetical protein